MSAVSSLVIIVLVSFQSILTQVTLETNVWMLDNIVD